MQVPKPSIAYLDGGERLHLQYGPIDLIIGCDAKSPAARQAAFEAATSCFDGLLERLVQELDLLRSPCTAQMPIPTGPVARRMVMAARPFCRTHFLTPMIAVAGSVADTVLEAMTAATPLRRAYVNNGGDIALHLAPGEDFSIAVSEHSGTRLGKLAISSADGIRGVATSGAKGRSHSMGIADSVTVLARSAANADVCATLIANAVDLPDNPDIRRSPADELSPDSDLGARAVVTSVPALPADACRQALANGAAEAEEMLRQGKIIGAALFLQGHSHVIGKMAAPTENDLKELTHA